MRIQNTMTHVVYWVKVLRHESRRIDLNNVIAYRRTCGQVAAVITGTARDAVTTDREVWAAKKRTQRATSHNCLVCTVHMLAKEQFQSNSNTLNTSEIS